MVLHSNINRQEKRWLWLYSLGLILLTTVPYLLAFWMENESWTFSGFLFGIEDGNSYIAKMLRGYQGDWLFYTPYTTFEQSGVVAFLPYLLLGKLAGGEEIHRQNIILFHLFRIAMIPLVVFATYRFISLFIEHKWYRRWALVLATIGGGLGWLLLLLFPNSLFNSMPLEFISPETFGFLSVYGLPHLILARALLLFALVFYLEGIHDSRKSWVGGILTLILALVQPLSVLVLLAVIGTHVIGVALATRKKAIVLSWLKDAIRVALPASPIIFYLVWKFSVDPFLVLWTSQNRILSPHIVHYLIAYGLVIIPAIVGLIAAIRRRDETMLLPVVWVILALLLAYFPHNLQRRLPEGSWVAWTVLAGIGLLQIFRTERGSKYGGIIVLVGSLIGSVLLLIGGIRAVRTLSQPIYRPAYEESAFNWLAGHVEDGDTVIASYETSNALPAWAPVQVIVGHGPESVNLNTLLPSVEAFFQAQTSDAERLKLIEQHDVRFVFLGPNEQGDWEPIKNANLRKIYSEGGYQIFAVEVLE